MKKKKDEGGRIKNRGRIEHFNGRIRIEKYKNRGEDEKGGGGKNRKIGEDGRARAIKSSEGAERRYFKGAGRARREHAKLVRSVSK